MQHPHEMADESSQGDVSRSGSLGDHMVVSEESATGAPAPRAADNTHEAATPPAGPGLAGAALELPSEAHFKQLASLHLLRATYQQEEDREIDRLSVERVLQSARRQNSAQRIRLAYMQQQIADQLRITEAQERRMAELLTHLQDVRMQSADISMHEDTILQIIGDMNDVRAGNPRETHSFLAQAASLGGTGVDTWSALNAMPSFFQICELFYKGQAASCHLQFSLAPLTGRAFCLQDMSTFRPEVVFQVVKGYEEAMKAQLQLAALPDPQQAAASDTRMQRLVAEFFVWLTALVIGQPPTYRTQHPWWKQRGPTASDIPLETMQDALAHVRLREEQMVEIQRQWRQHSQAVSSLEEAEQVLRDTLRGELNQAASLPDSQGLFLPMMESAAQLKANRAAHADRVLLFNSSVGLRMMEPGQCANMFAFLAPYQWRADAMLAAGLMQPTGNLPPPPA